MESSFHALVFGVVLERLRDVFESMVEGLENKSDNEGITSDKHFLC